MKRNQIKFRNICTVHHINGEPYWCIGIFAYMLLLSCLYMTL